MKAIKMPIQEDYQYLTSLTKGVGNNNKVYMTYLTDKEEKSIDAGQAIALKRGDLMFHITATQIYCYGEIDWTNDSPDMKTIDKFDFLKDLDNRGYIIPSDYDFEEHTCYTPNKTYRVYETRHPAKVAKYAYACLNKPPKIILFRQQHDSIRRIK